ncbi:uncharacterized protein LOC125449725 isoform X2 [Stegostoma tigrinum]|nr:uncharacterized protein LOC125449725 isoform X2 [Stegostoma tigrinum]
MLPLMSSTSQVLLMTYSDVKRTNWLTSTLCNALETGARMATGLAVRRAKPILDIFEPQFASANTFASKRLDKLEEEFPILQLSIDEVAWHLRESLTLTLDNAQEHLSEETMKLRVRAGALAEQTRAFISCQAAAFLNTGPGQLMAARGDSWLRWLEEMVDRHLPDSAGDCILEDAGVRGFERDTPEEPGLPLRVQRLTLKVHSHLYQRVLLSCQRAQEVALTDIMLLMELFDWFFELEEEADDSGTLDSRSDESQDGRGRWGVGPRASDLLSCISEDDLRKLLEHAGSRRRSLVEGANPPPPPAPTGLTCPPVPRGRAGGARARAGRYLPRSSSPVRPPPFGAPRRTRVRAPVEGHRMGTSPEGIHPSPTMSRTKCSSSGDRSVRAQDLAEKESLALLNPKLSFPNFNHFNTKPWTQRRQLRFRVSLVPFPGFFQTVLSSVFFPLSTAHHVGAEGAGTVRGSVLRVWALSDGQC